MQKAERKAVEALEIMKVFADGAIYGYAQLTDIYLENADSYVNWLRTYLGIIWALIYDGLGQPRPTPPPWPQEVDKLRPCLPGIYRPCGDCPLRYTNKSIRR